ncbi:MAG: hypothetical protein ACRBN8_01920 [Nannocystales bacterium]
MTFSRLHVPLGLLLALSACGDDDSAPAATGSTGVDTESDPGTSSISGSPTSTTDAGSSTGPGQTTDADASSGTTTEGGEESSSTGSIADPEPSYFRITSLNIRDPHFFVLIEDVTDVINDSVNEGLTTDDPDRPDGMLDLGFVLSFEPLDQSDGASADFSLVNAQCVSPVAETSCDILPGTQLYPTTYTSSAEGECYAATPSNLSDYDDPPAAPTPTTGPCFITAPTDVSIIAGAVELPLSNALVSARFVGDPADNIVEGNLEGFISMQDAEETEVSTPLGDFQLDRFLDDDDADGAGWVFHIAFTAEAVDWTGK